MDSNSEHVSDVEYVSDNNIQEEVKSSTKEPDAKKIRINFSNPNKPKKKSYIWSYFEEEDKNDVCKIIVTKKNKETVCNKSYKHNGGTENMKTHL
ncbi:15320_t:CDS:2 [Cetraspora pellucida]|uniref:15320_t:CDS:1 n=1 Tax=Cetraspora pellucida TaxID=1433469 RepID=A0ACA9MBA2_9GLOM|nr:15320_t:CDS:2 [Cetraspora pellucida]